MSFGQMVGLYLKVCIVFSVACFMVGLITAIVSAFGKNKAKIYDPPRNWQGAFVSESELAAAGCFENQSNIAIGAFVGRDGKPREVFYNPEPGMLKPVIVFGNMGSFKSTAFVMPLLLRWGLRK